jgi:nucleotide-binding universal stress UspA family protein
MTHRILVATDLGSAATHALERVLHLAKRVHDVEVHVVSVCLPGDSESRVRAALADHFAAHVPSSPIRAPALHVRAAPSIIGGIGNAADELRASLVAVGSRGGHLLAGGVAEGLLDRLTTDLLVVRPHRDTAEPTHEGRVIVGVDFSDASRRAIDTAAPFRGDHMLGLVHVVETDPHALPRVPRPEPEAGLDPLRERLLAWAGSLPACAFVERGEIGATLGAVAERERASLIVVGARGVRDRRGALGNTAAARLIRSAGPPVLVVR